MLPVGCFGLKADFAGSPCCVTELSYNSIIPSAATSQHRG